ncbi:NADH-quinone oxidoreductase subunit NuoE [Dyadobacter bucti]|uniref:NADH-quinone oxidoreductase subunit NuoE n=1 Tax=Dyadobacter bucti TaxID=2572203 RepID=UPI001109F8AE|nr:NADH-quinone oxidoreductase subunit NuoE [Dyadobacter bucti]
MTILETLTTEEITEIDHEISLVPFRKAAAIEALKVVQQHRGWVSDESLRAIAGHLEISPEELESVATFYNLVFRRPVGRNVILLCDSISCYVMGYQKIYGYIRDRLHISFGETTPDGRFTLLPNACLGTCDHAPALMINNELFRDLTEDRLDEILDGYH